MKLNINDYKSILEYYNIKYNNKTNTFIIKLAKKILITKLCRCINKVSNKSKSNKSKSNKSKSNKSKSNKFKNIINNLDGIFICNNSVMIKKGIKPEKFTCKKNKKFLNSNLEKLKKTLRIKKNKSKNKN